MTTNDIASKALVYNGAVIRDRNEMLSLTDMWKAQGAPENMEPFNWARFEGRAFIEAVALSQNLSEAQVIAAKRGKGGGTFAHWQIGIAYAKYLSPEFHMWCNEVVRERMEGKPPAPVAMTLDTEVRKTLGGIVKSVVHSQLAEIHDQINNLLLGVNARVAALEYVSVRELLEEAKALQKGRRSINRKIGHELKNRALLAGPPAPCRRCPHSGVWLFQRDFASLYMKEAGAALVADHNARQRGQGNLFVIPAKGGEARV